MKTHDQGSSLFWLLLSIYVCIESLRLEIGTLRNPGMGFMTFGASVLLGTLSLGLLFHSIFRKEEARVEPLFSGTLWKRIILVLMALLLYTKLLPLAGYLLGTFFLMSFLFWIIERKKVWRVLILSFTTTVVTYYVFSKWLNCQFPSGLIGF